MRNTEVEGTIHWLRGFSHWFCANNNSIIALLQNKTRRFVALKDPNFTTRFCQLRGGRCGTVE